MEWERAASANTSNTPGAKSTPRCMCIPDPSRWSRVPVVAQITVVLIALPVFVGVGAGSELACSAETGGGRDHLVRSLDIAGHRPRRFLSRGESLGTRQSCIRMMFLQCVVPHNLPISIRFPSVEIVSASRDAQSQLSLGVREHVSVLALVRRLACANAPGAGRHRLPKCRIAVAASAIQFVVIRPRSLLGLRS